MDFKSAEEKFQSIENAYHSGRLSDHDYQAAVSQIGVQDGAGRQWKIQPYSGQWHVYDRGGWHPARRPQPQVNTGHRRIQQRPAQPIKRRKPWIYVGGCALLVTVVVCIMGGLGMFGIIGLGFIGEDSLERRIIQSQDFVLDGSGGVYQIGAMTLEIGPNNLGQQLLIKLTEYDMPLEAGITDQTSLFRLEGLPAEFRGELHTRINLDQSLLDTLDRGDAEAAKSLTFYLGSYSYAPSLGDFTFSKVPVEAEFDLVTGQASTMVQFGYDHGQASGNVMASMIMPAVAEQVRFVAFTENDLLFIAINDGGHEYVVSDHFVIYYSRIFSYERLSSLIDQLEWVYQDLMAMGWEWPLDYQNGQSEISRQSLDGLFKVYIQDCDPKQYVYFGRTTDDCSGLFKVDPILGVSLLIHPRTRWGDVSTLKATVGHELMHAAQYAFHMKRDGYTFRSWFRAGGGANSWMMLDEAVATWYEQRALGDPNWIPSEASLHCNFYEFPWFFERNRKKAEHAGYGASWFIHYLVSEYGSDFILEAYKTQHITGGSDALVHVLQASGVSQSMSSGLFPGFLHQYFLEPQKFADGLASDKNYKNILRDYLNMRVNRRRLEFDITRVDRDPRGKGQASASPGTIINLGNGEQALQTPATVTVGATLPASMTAYYFYYDIPGDGASWQEGQVITIEGSGGGGGIMVQGLDKNNRLVEFAGVNNYLSDIDRRVLTVDAANYQRLNFILFNDSPLSSSGSQFVMVNITYGQEMLEHIVEQPPETDFNARFLMESAMLRLGVQEALSDRDDLCGQRFCQFSTFVADEDQKSSSGIQIGLHETNRPTSYTDWSDLQRSYVTERENFSFITEPHDFMYQGFNAYISKYLETHEQFSSVLVKHMETISLFGNNWYLEIRGHSSCEISKIDGIAILCEPDPTPDLYPWIDAIIDEGLSSGMIQ